MKQENQNLSETITKNDTEINELKTDIKEKNFIIKSLTQKIKSVVKDFNYDSFINECKSKVKNLFSPTL